MKASDVESAAPAEKDEHIGGGVGAIRDVINMGVNRIAAGVAVTVKRRQNVNSHVTRYRLTFEQVNPNSMDDYP